MVIFCVLYFLSLSLCCWDNSYHLCLRTLKRYKNTVLPRQNLATPSVTNNLILHYRISSPSPPILFNYLNLHRNGNKIPSCFWEIVSLSYNLHTLYAWTIITQKNTMIMSTTEKSQNTTWPDNTRLRLKSCTLKTITGIKQYKRKHRTIPWHK